MRYGTQYKILHICSHILKAYGMAQASVAQQMRAAQASAEAAQCFPGSPKPLLNVVATTLSSGLGNPGKLPLQPQNPEP